MTKPNYSRYAKAFGVFLLSLTPLEINSYEIYDHNDIYRRCTRKRTATFDLNKAFLAGLAVHGYLSGNEKLFQVGSNGYVFYTAISDWFHQKTNNIPRAAIEIRIGDTGFYFREDAPASDDPLDQF